jgi:hypothetical protein
VFPHHSEFEPNQDLQSQTTKTPKKKKKERKRLAGK